MYTSRSVCLATLLGLVTAVPLTASPLPGFVLKAQTARFSFYTRHDLEVDAARNERYLAELERLLGLSLPGRVVYYRHASPQELAACTGTYATGVAFRDERQIHSTEAFHAHEIVHLVAGQLGDPGAFFQEGLAIALGNGSRWRGRPVDNLARERARGLRPSWLVAHFERIEPEVAYALAGSFVSALIRTHGVARVAEFFRACAATGGDREEAFASTFGQSLDQAGAAWLAGLSTGRSFRGRSRRPVS